MIYNVNGVDHEIVTIIKAEQDQAYYDVLERCDAYAAHMLHIPDWHKPLWMIQSEIRMIDLKAKYDYEMQRIKDMSPEMLKIEIKLGFK